MIIKKTGFSFKILFFLFFSSVTLQGFYQSAFGDEIQLSPSLNEQIQLLEQKIEKLEKEIHSEKNSPVVNPKDQVLSGGGRDGFILISSDGDYLLNLKGVLQFDSFFFAQDNPTLSSAPGDFSYSPSTFTPRKVRLYFEGTVSKYYDFRLLPDFGNGQTVVQDAYLDIHYWSGFRLKGGKYKSPVGLERLQDETSLTFFERALPTNLVPNRDVGFLFHGELWSRSITYALGVLNGAVDGQSLDSDVNNDKEGVARIFVRPFKSTVIDYLKGLGIGLSGTWGNPQKGTLYSSNLPLYKTVGQTTFFSYSPGVVSDGQHFRYSPQANYYWGPIGFLSEYAVSSQSVAAGSNSASLSHSSWQTAVSYVLTGEKASYLGLVPEFDFDPEKGHWGAFELAFRYSDLKIDSNAFPVYASPYNNAAGAHEWGGGVNWYLNRNVKLVLDYFDTGFDSVSGGTGHNDERVILSRFQLAF